MTGDRVKLRNRYQVKWLTLIVTRAVIQIENKMNRIVYIHLNKIQSKQLTVRNIRSKRSLPATIQHRCKKRTIKNKNVD